MTWQENAQGDLQSSLSAVLWPASGYCRGGALPKGCIHPFIKEVLWILINSFSSESRSLSGHLTRQWLTGKEARAQL